MTVEFVSASRKFGGDRLMAVNFAIVDDHETPIGRDHGLMSRGGQIEDREAPMHERHAGFFVDPNAVIVRSAVLQTDVHGRRYVGQLACKTARGAGKKASN